MIAPLALLTNHRHPNRLDEYDFVSFIFKVEEASKTKKERRLTFPAQTNYEMGEEFNYGYSRNL